MSCEKQSSTDRPAVSTTTRSLVHGWYSRSSTACHPGSSNPSMSDRRDSIRRRCSAGSLHTTSMLTNPAAAEVAIPSHARRVCSSVLQESATTSKPRRSWWVARRGARRYPCSSTLRPHRSRNPCSIVSIRRWVAPSDCASLAERVVFPVPGKPAKMYSSGISFVLDLLRPSLGRIDLGSSRPPTPPQLKENPHPAPAGWGRNTQNVDPTTPRLAPRESLASDSHPHATSP